MHFWHFRTHHHLQTTKKSACLAQQDAVSEIPFLTDATSGKSVTCDNSEFTTGPQHADATNHRHLSQNDQLERKNHGRMTYRQPHSDDGQTFRKIPLLPGSSRSEKLCSLPPGLARVPLALFGGRKPARRGCRGRRGTLGLLQREISTGVLRISTGDILPGAMSLLTGVREAQGHFLLHSNVGSAVLHRGAEDPHVWCIWTVMIRDFFGRGTGAWAFTCCGW